MKRIRRDIEGSFTVEASLIMTAVIFSLAAVIYLGMSLHDSAMVQMIAVQGVFVQDVKDDLLTKTAGKETLLTDHLSYQKETSGNTVKVSFAGKVHDPINHIQKAEGEVSYKRTDPNLFLRSCRLMMKLREEKEE